MSQQYATKEQAAREQAAKVLALCLERPDQMDFIKTLAEQAGVLSSPQEATPAQEKPKAPATPHEPPEDLQYLELAVQEVFGVEDSLLSRSRGRIARRDPFYLALRCFVGEALRNVEDDVQPEMFGYAIASLGRFRADHKNHLRNDSDYRKKVERVRAKQRKEAT